MPKSVSIASLLIIFTLGSLTLMAMISGVSSYTSLLSLQGLVIVVGGSVANAYLSYQREDVMKSFITIRDMFKHWEGGRARLGADIKLLIKWSYLVQMRDFKGLEQECKKHDLAPVMRYGIDLVVSAYEPDKIREMMQTVAESEFERCTTPVTVLRNMAATAPAFGMVGTLVGMVAILKDVGTDIGNIGGGLALAMLATLYGILVARLVCLPAADKLLHREEAERMRHYMLAEGFGLLAEKQSPFYMLDRLNSFMDPAKHFNLSNYKQFARSKQPRETVALAA